MNGNHIADASGAVIRLNGPDGYRELLVDASGQTVFTGSVDNRYFVSIDRFVQIKNGFSYLASDYVSDMNFMEIFLDTDKTISFVLKPNSGSEFVSVSGTVSGLL